MNALQPDPNAPMDVTDRRHICAGHHHIRHGRGDAWTRCVVCGSLVWVAGSPCKQVS